MGNLQEVQEVYTLLNNLLIPLWNGAGTDYVGISLFSVANLFLGLKTRQD